MNKKVFSAFLLTFLVSLSGCGGGNDPTVKPSPTTTTPSVNPTPSGQPGTPTPSITPFNVSILVNDLVGNQELHTEKQIAFFESEDYETLANQTRPQDAEDSKPKAVTISWSVDHQDFDYFTIEVSEKNDFSNKWTYRVDKTNTSYDIINCKVDTTYYYKVGAIKGNESVYSPTKQFHTCGHGSRLIDIDQVTNCRDLGGQGKIKQGLIYRTSAFNNYEINNTIYNISEKGSEVVLKQLGIKTEIDLRKASETGGIDSSPLGDDVLYLSLPLYYGGNNILTYNDRDKNGDLYNNPATIKTILSFMADENNYPMAFHCVRGTDRTGCIAYLLGALLGLSQEELFKDYLFSNYGLIGSKVSISNIYNQINPTSKGQYVNVINQANGDSLAEKAYNYLIDTLGMTSQTVDQIINILKA